MSEEEMNVTEQDAPAPVAKKKTARKKAAKKKTARKKTAQQPEMKLESEPVPETFSAAPDDLDKEHQQRTQKEEPQQHKPQEEKQDGSQSDSQTSGEQSKPDDRSHRQHQGGHKQHGHNKQQHGHNKQNRNNNNRQQQPNKQHGGGNKNPNFNKNRKKNKKGGNQNYASKEWIAPGSFADYSDADTRGPEWGNLHQWDIFKDFDELEQLAAEKVDTAKDPCELNHYYSRTLPELEQDIQTLGIERGENAPVKRKLLEAIIDHAAENKQPIYAEGVLEIMENGFGFITYQVDNYRPRELSIFVPAQLIRRYGLMRGHLVRAIVHPARKEEQESCPFVLRIDSVMGIEPDKIAHLTPFTELVPYYPTERALLETSKDAKWDNISMRVVDLLTPIGLGQRGLIVAPPRTGKTVLMQGIANSLLENKPKAHLIILLVDERPEEVTDFRRQINDRGEVISSTFDESAESHVHAAEMVIEKARRMVEVGKDVIILLDSITRLARAYNTLMPSSGKILSGGVEASALQKPKRFFGSARNIEDGGSLTILGTALVETGSRMDEVIFEEFKGTGNMELHLERALVDKRIFPALSFEKSGTRKEEMLYHPDELNKIYSLRRAMKGVPSTEAMEMLIQRVKKTKTNAEFLMAMNR